MVDKNLQLQTLTTLTAGTSTSIVSTSKDLLTTPIGREDFCAQVRFDGSIIATSAVTATFTVSESSDNTTFYQNSRQRSLVIASGTITDQIPTFVPFVRTDRCVNLTVAFSNTTSGLTLPYQCYLSVFGRP